MKFITFDTYSSYQYFMKQLKAKCKIMHVSKLKHMKMVPPNRTGVYISSSPETITVFFEHNKIGSLRTNVA